MRVRPREMVGKTPKVEVSSLSREFADDGITVDVQIYRIEGNDGWTLELVVDEETSIAWTHLFATDQEAWDEFANGMADVGLRALLEADGGEEATVH